MEKKATMYDLTRLQAQHRIADIDRMMTRVNGPGETPVPLDRRKRLRVSIARKLLALAARLAPITRERRTA
jgi:hypothetical protein